jgi:pimeloyl-ACP methyl ester carboxylesterase
MSFRGADGNGLVGDLWGAGDGGLVVFLHGAGQTRHSWRRACAALAEQGGRALALDGRGHGDSEWVANGDYRADRQVEDVKRVLAAVGEPVTIVGASMGGLTGLEVADALGPARVTGLVMVDIVPWSTMRGGSRVQDFMRANPEGFSSLEEAADAVAAYLPHQRRPRSPEGLRRNLRLGEDGRWRWHWDPAFIGSRAVAEKQSSRRQRMLGLEQAATGLSIPLVVLRGALSDVVGPAEVERFLRAVPHAEVIALPDTGHTAAGADNDAFSKVVVRLLRRLAG